MFDMLCGRPPFEAGQSSEVLAMHIHRLPPSPREFAPHREITEQAEQVIVKAMQKDANKRYQDMVAFRRDLELSYGSISYRRHGSKPRGVEPRGQENRAPAPRLTEDLDEWIANDPTAITVDQARMVALADSVERQAKPASPSRSPAEAERLANDLDHVLKDEES